MDSLQKAKWRRHMRITLALIAVLLGIGIGAFIGGRQTNNLRATSIPVLALADLDEDVDYCLESLQTVVLSDKDGYQNYAVMVIISSDNLSGYNHCAALVVAKQLVEICPTDSTQPASATVTTVVSEGGQTRILHLRPRYLRPDPEPRALLAVLPAGTK